MRVLIIVLLVCGTFCVDFVNGLTKEEIMECEREWRTIICEKNDDTLLNELEACDDLASKEIIDVFHGCESVASPENFGTVKFMKAACADETVFNRYDACMEPSLDDGFLEQVLENVEAMECYEKVMEKNGILSASMKLSRRL